MSKIKKKRFKTFGQEVISVIDYLLHEAVAQNKSLGYRLKIPYSSIATSEPNVVGDLVLEISVTYDGEFKEEPDEQSKAIKITGPSKGRH